MKVLFDTNVILDALLEREPFFENAATLFKAIGQGKIEAFVSATSIKDTYFLICKETKDKDRGLQAVKDLLKLMQICEVNKSVIERAIELNFKDFEDAIQVAAVEPIKPDVIVTRNIKDFKGTSILKMRPKDLCEQLE